MTEITARVVAHSRDKRGEEVISYSITLPRYILAEVNTHKMLSKNTSSSRAIPFSKMVESIKKDPFIPIAWQKDHSGMQGTEYLDENAEYDIYTYTNSLKATLNTFSKGSKEWVRTDKKIKENTKLTEEHLTEYKGVKKTLKDWWLLSRDKAVETACLMYSMGVTKQLCNRLLEPFMWTTMLITGSRQGFENFFNLRCPQYSLFYEQIPMTFKSKKELIAFVKQVEGEEFKNDYDDMTDLDWLKINKGQAEIHIMALAESMYDAWRESTPKLLKDYEWHIPFEEEIPTDNLEEKIKCSVAMSARTSYTIIEDDRKNTVEKLCELHDRLLAQDPPHSSPLEHVCRALPDELYNTFIKGELVNSVEIFRESGYDVEDVTDSESKGWVNNIKGFMPYRYMIDNDRVPRFD